MNILILGSKPNSSLPNIKPNIIYSANGAASIMNKFNSGEKYSVVSSGMTYNDDVVNKLIESNPDKVIIRSHNKNFNNELYNYFDDIILIDGKSMCMFENSIFRYRAYLARILHFYNRGGAKGIKLLKDHVLGSYRTFACSTGLWTLAYCLSKHPQATIYISGIGLQAGGHYYKRGEFQSITANKDYYLMKNTNLNNFTLRSTDEYLSKTSNIKYMDS